MISKLRDAPALASCAPYKNSCGVGLTSTFTPPKKRLMNDQELETKELTLEQPKTRKKKFDPNEI
jgi:hypothetical protein